MPPKKNEKSASKGQQKSQEKQKQKLVEDKTFGLKNKNKSKQVQKYIKGVQQKVKGQSTSEQILKEREHHEKEEKKVKLKQEELIASLFKGTENIKKIAVDDIKKTDPKKIKADQLIDVYTDQRLQIEDTIDKWDQKKLEEVVRIKHGKSQGTTTDIVCKYFLQAVEKKQYGWFWTCPNGGNTCKYRHCLPPGYVLNFEPIKEGSDNTDVETLEESIERKRAQLPTNGTKLTLELFLTWKKERELEKTGATPQKEQMRSLAKENKLSGKNLFLFNPSLFVDDDAAASESDYKEDEEMWENIVKENQSIIDKANTEALQKQSEASDIPEAQIDTEHIAEVNSSQKLFTGNFAVNKGWDEKQNALVGKAVKQERTEENVKQKANGSEVMPGESEEEGERREDKLAGLDRDISDKLRLSAHEDASDSFLETSKVFLIDKSVFLSANNLQINPDTFDE